MDHKVSKDMISSGMIPSGEKTQADLGRTQYGSAPSPSSLADAYKSIYEHHQKDKDGNTIPHEGEEVKEGVGAALKAASLVVKNLAKNKVAQNIGRGAATQFGASAVGNVMSGNQKQQKPTGGTVSASADLFDIVKGQLLDEGLSEEEIRDIMLTLTPDEILKEMDTNYPAGKGGNYQEKPKVNKPEPKPGEDGSKFDSKGRPRFNPLNKDPYSGKQSKYDEEYKNFDPKNPDSKQVAAQAQLEKNKQKFNDPMGVKNTNIGGRGKDLG